MKELWEMEDWGGELRLRSWPVTKETALNYFLDKEGRERRVEKKYLDTEPGRMLSTSYGRFFTSRDMAVSVWYRHYKEKIRKAERVIEAINQLGVEPETTVASYREAKDGEPDGA